MQESCILELILMTDAMEPLFQYAQEHMVHSLLLQEDKYDRAAQCSEAQREALRILLDQPAQNLLDSVLREKELFGFMHERALFRAGFRLAIELLR